MTRARLLGFALLPLIAAVLAPATPGAAGSADTAPPAASADELAGLWKAKRWFGPFARGPLVLRKTGETYTADMAGRTTPARLDGREQSFELPNGQGSFRGKLQAGGAGGQAVLVIPELDLVVATFAGNYSSKGTTHTSQNLIARYILPAVREPGDDKSAPVVPREDWVTPYGRSTAGSGPVSPPR